MSDSLAPEALAADPFWERRDEILDLIGIITERCRTDPEQRHAATDLFAEAIPGFRALAQTCGPLDRKAA